MMDEVEFNYKNKTYLVTFRYGPNYMNIMGIFEYENSSLEGCPVLEPNDELLKEAEWVVVYKIQDNESHPIREY